MLFTNRRPSAFLRRALPFVRWSGRVTRPTLRADFMAGLTEDLRYLVLSEVLGTDRRNGLLYLDLAQHVGTMADHHVDSGVDQGLRLQRGCADRIEPERLHVIGVVLKIEHIRHRSE